LSEEGKKRPFGRVDSEWWMVGGSEKRGMANALRLGLPVTAE